MSAQTTPASGPRRRPGTAGLVLVQLEEPRLQPACVNRVVTALAVACQPAPPPCLVGPRRLLHRLGHAVLAPHGAPI